MDHAFNALLTLKDNVKTLERSKNNAAKEIKSLGPLVTYYHDL